MEKICLVYGGDSVESEISILTALKIQKELEKYSFPHMMVFLDHHGNFYSGKALLHKSNYQNLAQFKKGTFYKNNEEYYFKSGFKKEKFDLVLLLCHGYNAEDGTLGGFFDTLKIPCLYPGLIQSAIMQDKVAFKRIMSNLNVAQTKYLVINEEEFSTLENKDIVGEKLKYPLIVKPSHLGSSIGVKKANDEKELIEALFDGFRYDDALIIEEAVLNLKEINIALLRNNGEIVTSDLERVNADEKVLSFIDKYDNYSLTETHVIPADIDKKVAKNIIFTAKKVYQKLSINSLVRFDFLLDEKANKIYLNEVNAIPGSLSTYLFEKQDVKTIDLIEMLINEFKTNRINKQKKISSYKEGFLDSLKEK